MNWTVATLHKMLYITRFYNQISFIFIFMRVQGKYITHLLAIVLHLNEIQSVLLYTRHGQISEWQYSNFTVKVILLTKILCFNSLYYKMSSLCSVMKLV